MVRKVKRKKEKEKKTSETLYRRKFPIARDTTVRVLRFIMKLHRAARYRTRYLFFDLKIEERARRSWVTFSRIRNAMQSLSRLSISAFARRFVEKRKISVGRLEVKFKDSGVPSPTTGVQRSIPFLPSVSEGNNFSKRRKIVVEET